MYKYCGILLCIQIGQWFYLDDNVEKIHFYFSEFEVGLKGQPDLNSVSVITMERGICGSIETHHGKCIWHNRTLQCHGAIFNMTSIQFHRLINTHEIIFCGWPNEKFDPSILRNFPKLNKLHFENGDLLHIVKDFPPLKHLKVMSVRTLYCGHIIYWATFKTYFSMKNVYFQYINISYTRLSHLHSTIFKHLSTIKTIDLRRNQLDYYDDSLILPSKFQELYLSGKALNYKI